MIHACIKYFQLNILCISSTIGKIFLDTNLDLSIAETYRNIFLDEQESV